MQWHEENIGKKSDVVGTDQSDGHAQWRNLTGQSQSIYEQIATGRPVAMESDGRLRNNAEMTWDRPKTTELWETR